MGNREKLSRFKHPDRHQQSVWNFAGSTFKGGWQNGTSNRQRTHHRKNHWSTFWPVRAAAWLCLVYFLRIPRSEPSSFVPGFSCWESDFSKRRAMINRCLSIWNSTERSRYDEKIFTQDCMCPLARGNRLSSFCFVSPGDVFSVEQHHHLYFVCRLFAGYGCFFHCSFSAKIVRFSIFC